MAIRAARPDAEIEKDIKDSLYADLRIVSDNVDVQVVDGKAHLRGTVPDEAQKSLARAVADRIKGVRQVINELEIDSVAARADADITADVAAALAADTLVDEDKIEVTTVDGVVYLRGTVSSHTERKAADEDTKAIRGVVDVIDEIMVAPSYARSDEEIATEVRKQIQKNLKLDGLKLEVEVRHSIVHLMGNVSTMEQRWLADELARWTPGAIDVVNDLKVVSVQGP